MTIWVRLGGWLPATEIAAHSAPTWETQADGGHGEASFDMAISAKVLPPLLERGTLVEIMLGGSRLHVGRINDYDRAEGRVIVRGIQTDAYQLPALGPDGVTRDIVTAINTAVAAPYNWIANNRNGVAGVATGNTTQPQMIGELFDEYVAQLGYRWYLDTNLTVFMGADPASPTWMATPDAAAFGATDEGSPTMLIGRYFNGTENVNAVQTKAGARVVRTEFRDLTNRGTLTGPQADAILAAELTTSGPSWVNGITLSREQLTTIGGTPAFLPAVHARSTMLRAHGLMADGVIQAPWLDVVIGKTRYTAGEDTIYLEPANKAPRGLEDVVAAS